MRLNTRGKSWRWEIRYMQYSVFQLLRTEIRLKHTRKILTMRNTLPSIINNPAPSVGYPTKIARKVMTMRSTLPAIFNIPAPPIWNPVCLRLIESLTFAGVPTPPLGVEGPPALPSLRETWHLPLWLMGLPEVFAKYEHLLSAFNFETRCWFGRMTARGYCTIRIPL